MPLKPSHNLLVRGSNRCGGTNDLASVLTFTKLVNNNLLQEERKGSMFLVKVGPKFARVRNDFQSSISQWRPIVEKTTDLFLRMNTDQAEVVAVVIFAADALRRQRNSAPSETEVLDSVMQWMKRGQPPIEGANGSINHSQSGNAAMAGCQTRC